MSHVDPGFPSPLTRRNLLFTLVAGGIGSLVAACTSGSSNPSSGGAPSATTAPATGPTSAASAASAATTAPQAAAAGSGNTLRVLMWQGPTILNPHLSSGSKDAIAARFCCEPLITVDANGTFAPILAAEVPSQQNGGLSADGTSVTYKLKQGVTWADGQPFTADDVVFTYQYASNPETAAVTAGSYQDLQSVEAIDPTTVKLTFKQPTGGWYVPFLGTNGMVVPKHVLEQYTGANSRNAPWNLKSFGTGPYMTQDFKPGDTLTLVPNPSYREQGKPFFKEIDVKGGGDAVSAARAVFQTGEYDYAWNLQVESAVLNQMMQAGKGDLVTSAGGGVEQIFFNQADPNAEVNGQRGSPDSHHPFLTDQRVRQAMAISIDRQTMANQLYGQTGVATSNVLTTPTNLASPNTQ
ncbi:MAG: peptide ABC transporter substrate-binding protein, partial [Chloroflexi bacterium]|nr:peptide ABC transporter substrate-binding protein [Chloroflexota bacterium]